MKPRKYDVGNLLDFYSLYYLLLVPDMRGQPGSFNFRHSSPLLSSAGAP